MTFLSPLACSFDVTAEMVLDIAIGVQFRCKGRNAGQVRTSGSLFVVVGPVFVARCNNPIDFPDGWTPGNPKLCLVL